MQTVSPLDHVYAATPHQHIAAVDEPLDFGMGFACVAVLEHCQPGCNGGLENGNKLFLHDHTPAFACARSSRTVIPRRAASSASGLVGRPVRTL